MDRISAMWNATLDHFLNALFLGLLPIVVVGLAVGLAVRFTLGRNAGPVDAAVVFAFAFVGASAGLMIGSSRESITQAALPALLTLVSTFLAYVYAKRKETPEKEAVSMRIQASIAEQSGLSDEERGEIKDLFGSVRFIPAGIIALAIASITTSFYGASIRSVQEINDREHAEWLIQYKTIEVPINRDLLRKKAGLPVASEKGADE